MPSMSRGLSAAAVAVVVSACAVLIAACGAETTGNVDPPTETLAANPTTVASGGSSMLTWSTTNATTCSASGGWSGAKSVSGSQSTGALTATTGFTLSCSGRGGNVTQTATVTVAPAPTVTLTANPPSVASGGASTLTWSSADAATCTASGGWSGSKATSGNQSTGALTATTNYTLTCSGPGGSANQTATVTIVPAPTVSLTANPTNVASGGAATLTWAATNATACTASGGWSGSKATSGNQSTGALTVTTSYTLTCTGIGGSANQTATVTVSAAPSVSLTANPTSVASGGSSTLTWNATDATSCTASGGWSGSKATSGNQPTGALTATTSYTLTCSGPGGSSNQTATVTVVPAPTVALTANPTSIASGSAATLTWTTTNATSCTASGGWSGSKATSGNQSTGTLTATTSYTLTCTGIGGSGNQTATVTVVPAPTVALTANPTAIASGAASTLTWSSTNATSCLASGGWSGSKATSGSQSTGALTATTSYTLTCTGIGGSGNQTATVTVVPAPTVSLTANPTTVASGAASLLTWSSTNATTCTASGGWTGTKATSGNASTGALSATTTFTLACDGTGGSASANATVTVTPAPTDRFPLHVEAGKRYLIDAFGNPFLVHGDAPWDLVVQLTNAEVDQYLEDRRLKGFNTVLVEIIERYFSSNPPYDAYGNAPFLTPGDFSTPNEAYFAHVADVLTKAREKGFLVLLTPCYMGFGGGAEGWYADMVLNGATKLRAYGQYLATRFRSFDNILWVHGGDFDPPEMALARAIAQGIRDVDTKWLHTFHGYHHSALEVVGTGEPWLSVNNVYANANTVVPQTWAEYNRSTMPYFLIEAVYENEGADARVVRRQAYQAVLSGAAGQVMGNRPVWLFDTGWQAALNSDGARTLAHLRSLFDARAWWTLVPDTAYALVTFGVGLAEETAPVALAADRSFGLIYAPTTRNLTVDLSQLAGPNVVARWYDPTAGTFTTVSGSPFTATGSRIFATPGSNALGDADWVLVLTSSP